MKVLAKVLAVVLLSVAVAAWAENAPGSEGKQKGKGKGKGAQTETTAKKSAKPAGPPEDPSVPVPKGGGKDQGFLKLHDEFVKQAKEGKIGLLFLGDSITFGWRRAPEVWKKYYEPYRPGNFGIGGDRTQHVLWRITNGELDGITPKVVVLMIGTNNTNSNTAESIAAADKKIVETIRTKSPNTKVLLLAVFPRTSEPLMEKIKQINAALAKLDDGKNVRYLDIGPKFLDSQGAIPKDIMPDGLHPNVKGYEIWAEAMNPLLTEMMK